MAIDVLKYKKVMAKNTYIYMHLLIKFYYVISITH